MHRIIDVAIDTGYLPQNFKYLDQDQFSYLQPHEVVAAVHRQPGRAARGDGPRRRRTSIPTIKLDKGDLVIFSSRTIPGNERAVGQIQNRLVDMGCELVTDDDALVHVTGHPRREELKEMYGWVKPRIAIPMHGEARHLAEHAKLARAAGVQRGAFRQQRRHRAAGARARPRSSTRRRWGACSATGDLLVPSEDGPVRERRSLAFAGIVDRRACRNRRATASCPIPRWCSTACPRATPTGRPMLDIVRDAVEGTIASIPRKRRRIPRWCAKPCAGPCGRPSITRGASARSSRCC